MIAVSAIVGPRFCEIVYSKDAANAASCNAAMRIGIFLNIPALTVPVDRQFGSYTAISNVIEQI